MGNFGNFTVKPKPKTPRPTGRPSGQGVARDGGKMSNETRLEKLRQRYLAAAHRMQTGQAFMMNHDAKRFEPKHLRVGINSAMSDHGGLAKLLIKKGVITEEEYYEMVAEAMEREADMAEKEVQGVLGGLNVKLG